MERTLKFRGLRTDGKGWVYGDLIHCYDFTGNRDNDYGNTNIKQVGGSQYEVIPSSIGQFTGLTDKNGKDIYEGDLLELCDNKNGLLKVEFVNAYVGGWVLSHESTNHKLSLGARKQEELEVIGNIHEQ